MTRVTILELSTIRRLLTQFTKVCALRRGAIASMFTDNQVVMHIVNSTVSKSLH